VYIYGSYRKIKTGVPLFWTTLYVLPTVRSFMSHCVHVFYFWRINDDDENCNCNSTDEVWQKEVSPRPVRPPGIVYENTSVISHHLRLLSDNLKLFYFLGT